MTAKRTYASAAALIALLAIVFLAVLVSPSSESGPSYSTHSAGLTGTRLAYDLTDRLGWKPERRNVPFSDSLNEPARIQVLINSPVGGIEAHALLELARRGGGLLVVGRAGALSDSLPTAPTGQGDVLPAELGDHCTATPFLDDRMQQFEGITAIGWKRPPPADTVGFGELAVRSREDNSARSTRRPAVGFPFGNGRVVVVADANYIVNDLIRRCEQGTDVSLVRMMEYLTRGEQGTRVAFDEFAHGYGTRGGSFAAIQQYLGGTGSGRMLAQMAVAGLLLLIAAAPRPLAPRDPARVARRSPLEHADALAHAYSNVKATRTATARLVAGLRRRTRRDRTRGRDSDEQFLAAAAGSTPEAAAASAVVLSALDKPLPERELANVAKAIETIEATLSRPITPQANR